MPSLNIKGNVLEDFGTQLPNVVIESVNINNASLDVLISLYFNFEEDITAAERDEYIDDFSNVQHPTYVYVGYILGERYLNALVNKENTDIWSEFYNPTTTGAGRFAVGAARDLAPIGEALQDKNPNYKLLAFNSSDFSRSDQNFYDDNNNKIYQYSTTINIPIEFDLYVYETAYNWDLDLSEQTIVPDIFEILSRQLQDMNVIAFTSWINLNTPDLDSRITVQDHDNLLPQDPHGTVAKIRAFDYTTPDLMPLVKRQMTSDISYAKVFTDGKIDSGIKSAYMDSAGGSYNNTPIQAINGKLYKQDAYSLEQISALFSSYVSTVIVEDEEVQSVLDNITYVVETFGESSQLLLELNILRKAFPEKSSATAVGRLYEGFKSRFFGANEKVVAGTPVVEKLYKSSKIRDMRFKSISSTPRGEDQQPASRNFIYIYRSGAPSAPPNYAGEISDWLPGDWMSAVQVFTEGNYGQPEVSQYINTGFWFFDYQLALKQYASILSVFTLAEVNKIFGQDVIHEYFWLDRATMEKRQYIGENETDMIMNYITDTKLLMTTTIEIDHHGPLLTARTLPTTFENDYQNNLWGDPDQNCWLMIRGIQGLDIDDDHKLMCFQYQDIEKSYNGDYDHLYDKTDEKKFYTPSVHIVDETATLLGSLPDSFNNYFDVDFEQYYLMAAENCSYSITDGAFNDFFKNGIMANYGEEPEDHPWIVMPLLLNLHRDLLTGEFRGDEGKMKESANAVAAQINPINGTLSALEAFKNRCETFRADYYGPLSRIGEIIEAGAYGSGRRNFKIGSPNNYIFAKPPEPISTVDSEWQWTAPCPPGTHEDNGVCVDDVIATGAVDPTVGQSWIKDSAYVGLRYGWNFVYATEFVPLQIKIMDKWNWNPSLVSNYNSDASIENMGAIDDWLNESANSAKKDVIAAAAAWAEAHDKYDNNTGQDGPAVLRYASDFIYDGNHTKYRVAVKNVDDPDSFDTIRVYRWDYE